MSYSIKLRNILFFLKNSYNEGRLVMQKSRLTSFKKVIKSGRARSYWLWEAILFLIFLGVGISVLTGGGLIHNDQKFTSLTEAWRSPLATNAFIVITYLGQWQVILSIALVVILILGIFRQRRKATLLLTTLVLTLATSEMFKCLFCRSRPGAGLSLTSAQGYSFPSNHAVVSVVFYGMLCYFLLRFLKREWQQRLVIFLFSFLILWIGLSRIYLGVHWFSDVVGGWSLGLFLLILFLGFYQRWENKKS